MNKFRSFITLLTVIFACVTAPPAKAESCVNLNEPYGDALAAGFGHYEGTDALGKRFASAWYDSSVWRTLYIDVYYIQNLTTYHYPGYPKVVYTNKEGGDISASPCSTVRTICVYIRELGNPKAVSMWNTNGF